MNQGDDDYLKREKEKADSYLKYGDDEFAYLKLFKLITLQRWRRIEEIVRPTLYDFRSEVTRGAVLIGEAVCKEVLNAFPPAVGLLRLIPGDSEWYRTGVSQIDLNNRGIKLEIPRDILRVAKKKRY